MKPEYETMKVLETRTDDAPADRRSTRLLHDEPNVRVVAFHLPPGAAVPRHSNASTVMVTVLSGEGIFRGGESEERLAAGDAAVYAPGEPHSMETVGSVPLRFLATIAPRPAMRS